MKNRIQNELIECYSEFEKVFQNIPNKHAPLRSSKGLHCVKGVRIRSYSAPHFPTFGLNTQQLAAKLAAKFNVYGSGKERLKLLFSYFDNRRQRSQNQ